MRAVCLLLWAVSCVNLCLGKEKFSDLQLSPATAKAFLKSTQRISHITKHLRDNGLDIPSKQILDEESMYEHLSPMYVEGLKRIIEIDKLNMRIFEEFYSKTSVSTTQEDTIDPAIIGFLAEIVPIFAESKSCIVESLAVINALVNNHTWPILLADYSGKIPDGIYTNSWSPLSLVRPHFPLGTQFVPGSYDACLNLDHKANITIQTNSTLDLRIKGKWILMNLKANGSELNQDSIRKFDGQLPDHHQYTALLQKYFSKPETDGLFDIDVNGFPNVPGWLPSNVTAGAINWWSYKWGVCVPSACSEMDVTTTYNILLNKYVPPIHKNVSLYILPKLPSSTAESSKPVFGAGNITFIAVLSILCFLMLIGTVIDVLNRRSMRKDVPMTEKILKCFSVYENGTKVLSTKKGGADHITCIGGIRTISMAWVVLGHTFLLFEMYAPEFFQSNKLFSLGIFIDKKSYSPAVQLVKNALPSVDTFFYLSGLLVAYFTFIQLEKKKFNIIAYYVHRYVRLTVPYAFAILTIIYINPYIPKGPIAFSYESGAQNCRENWWVNILYLNDVDAFSKNLCMGVTWYLSNDMQMYWYSPVVLLPIWWNEKIGLALWCVQFLAFTSVQGVLTAYYHFGPTSMIGPDEHVVHGSLTQGSYYGKVYTRMQPYLIGLLMGYIFFKTRGKTIKIPYGFIVSSVLWILSVGVGLLVILGVQPMWINGYSNFQSTFYAMFFRVGWSLALAWTTFACAKGYGGPINAFLSWGPWTVLGRLTFFSYLIHFEIIPMIFESITYSFELNNFQIVMFYIGVLVIVMSTSFVLTLCFEMPFGGLEKIVMSKLLGGNKKKTTESPKKDEIKTTTKDSLKSSPEVIDSKIDIQSNQFASAPEPDPIFNGGNSFRSRYNEWKSEEEGTESQGYLSHNPPPFEGLQKQQED